MNRFLGIVQVSAKTKLLGNATVSGWVFIERTITKRGSLWAAKIPASPVLRFETSWDMEQGQLLVDAPRADLSFGPGGLHHVVPRDWMVDGSAQSGSTNIAWSPRKALKTAEEADQFVQQLIEKIWNHLCR